MDAILLLRRICTRTFGTRLFKTTFVPILFSLMVNLSFSVIQGGVPVVQAESIRVADFRAGDIGKLVPAGWELIRYQGAPNPNVQKEGDRHYLRMTGKGEQAYGIMKEISVDIKAHPFLNWSWRAMKLPRGGDIRKADKDDQALQIYVIFPAVGLPADINKPAVCYIWDNEAPKGLRQQSPQRILRRTRYIVVRNATDRMGLWYAEKRNLYEDYLSLFGDIGKDRLPESTQGVMLFINTHHTRSDASGDMGDVFFSAE